MEFKSFIFKPSKKKNFLEERKNLIGWIALSLAFLFIILEIYWLTFSLMFIILAVSYGIAIDRWNKIEPLNGSFPFRLSINESEITLGDKVYPMNETSITKLVCYDYRGRSEFGNSFFARHPIKSNGTWNHLWFIHNHKEYQLRFRCDSEKHSNQLVAIKKKLGM